MPQPKPLLTDDEISAMPEVRISHPWNPKSDIYLKRLAPDSGLARLSLSIARLPPGKESFVYHSHERDEEFVYILSGRGRAEIGDETFEVAPGDFMGFPAPDGPAHHLLNPYGEDLVYLMGGESSGFDIGHYPRMGKRILFAGSKILAIDDAGLTSMRFDEWLVGSDETD